MHLQIGAFRASGWLRMYSPKKKRENFITRTLLFTSWIWKKAKGIDFAKKYEVSVYPTYLYFNPEGELVHRSVGSKPLEMFIEDGKNALSPEKQFLSMKKKYENGERGEEFLYNYAFALFNANADPKTVNEVAVAYLSTQKEDDYISEKNWKVLNQLVTDINSAPFKYLEANKDKFTAKYGEEDVDMKISYSKMEYYSLNKQWNDYAKVVSGIADKYASDDWQMLNGFAWTFYENISDKSMLKKAAKWAKKSISLDKNYYNTDTYASLLYKLGKYDDALKYAKEAVELAKKSNQDYSGTEELIKKIEKKK